MSYGNGVHHGRIENTILANRSRRVTSFSFNATTTGGVWLAADGASHQARIVDRLARWFDAEAATIMAEMARGTRIRLGSYPDALKVYRQEIRRHGLLKGGRE